MAKQKAAEDEPQGTVKARRGLYRGHNGRSFQSVPFGETLLCRSGKVYTVGLQYSYLWNDPQFAALWEWKGDLEDVAPESVGQVVKSD
jgi:hypothetical protein